MAIKIANVLACAESDEKEKTKSILNLPGGPASTVLNIL